MSDIVQEAPEFGVVEVVPKLFAEYIVGYLVDAGVDADDIYIDWGEPNFDDMPKYDPTVIIKVKGLETVPQK